MCFFTQDTEDSLSDPVLHIYWMEYPLPGPVVALLEQEKASPAPKSYYISSGKKSIKITLVYSKGDEQARQDIASVGKQKSRHGSSSKSGSKKTTSRARNKNLSVSSSSSNTEHSENLSQSDNEQVCISPGLRLREGRSRGRERMSTVDSGHPSSSYTVSNEQDVHSESGSEAGDECCYSFSSSDSEKPRTPGREIEVQASTIGPGETPAARRDELTWQTWTRIPRTQAITRNLLSAPISTVRRSLSPSTATVQRTATTGVNQRRPRLPESVAWEGSGNL